MPGTHLHFVGFAGLTKIQRSAGNPPTLPGAYRFTIMEEGRVPTYTLWGGPAYVNTEGGGAGYPPTLCGAYLPTVGPKTGLPRVRAGRPA